MSAPGRRSSASWTAFIASLGMFIEVNERLPLPTDDFSPCRFSNTRVRQPMVATSYRYLLGSFALHFSLTL